MAGIMNKVYSIKIIQNFKEKGVATVPLGPPLKSALDTAFLCCTFAGRSESIEDRQLSLDDWETKNEALLSWRIVFEEGAPICCLATSPTNASDVLAMLVALPLLGRFE